MKAIYYRDDLGNQIESGEIPEELRAEAETHRAAHDRGASPRWTTTLTHKYLEGEELTEAEIERGLRLGTPADRDRPRPDRLGAQEQGHPADARRGHRLPALAARRAAGHRPRSRHRRRAAAHGRRRRALRGAGLQDRRRPVRRQAGLLPRLLGHAQGRLVRLQRRARAAGAHRAHPPDARQPPRGDRGGLRRRHRRRGRPQGHLHRRHAVRSRAPDHPRVDDLPRAGHRGRHRAQDEGRPGQARHRAPAPGRGGPDLPRQDRRGDRADPHRGHGRAAPRRPRRPHGARVQGRRQRRQAAGLLPRDDPRAAAEGNGRFVRQTGGAASTATP